MKPHDICSDWAETQLYVYSISCLELHRLCAPIISPEQDISASIQGFKMVAHFNDKRFSHNLEMSLGLSPQTIKIIQIIVIALSTYFIFPTFLYSCKIALT